MDRKHSFYRPVVVGLPGYEEPLVPTILDSDPAYGHTYSARKHTPRTDPRELMGAVRHKSMYPYSEEDLDD